MRNEETLGCLDNFVIRLRTRSLTAFFTVCERLLDFPLSRLPQYLLVETATLHLQGRERLVRA